MARGSKTDAVIREAFRAEYLLTANASKAARAVSKKLGCELNERTARDIAAELDEETEFSEARRKQRARYLEEAVAARQDVLRTALKRAKAKSADVYHFGEGGTAIDKRPDWAKVVLDVEKNAHALAKAESGIPDGKPTEVRITVSGPAVKAEAQPG